jgi:acyl-CoA synthetase (AMP-forming)/AMP-acid ligase II
MSASAGVPPPSDEPVHARVEERLLAPGGPFEMGVEAVLGVPTPVFRERQRSLREVLLASAAFGEREYLVCEERRIGFSEHLGLVASVARALAERFGVGKGDRVAILAGNGPEWIVTWWAAVCLGAIPVGMNGWWAGDEIVFALEDARPRLLVGDARRLARLAGREPGMPVVEIEAEFAALERFASGAGLPDVTIDEDDPVCMLYTSGTTGRPKGAVLSHRNLLALHRLYVFHGLRLLLVGAESQQAAASAARSEAKPSGAQSGAAPAAPAPCQLVTTPLFHASGLFTGAVTLLASGVKTVWTKRRFDPVRVMELIERERVTGWGPMGTMAERVIRHPDAARFDLSSLRQVGSGGAPVSPGLQARLREAFPNARAQLSVGYGLTEATAMATLNFGRELEARPESSGRPLPTIGVEIRDAEGRPLPGGEEGEIFLHGPTVFHGYWERPGANAETLLAGRWLRTGDWGRLEGGHLHVNARRRDLILRGSENVYPAEIERVLESHPDVEEVAVLGVDHPELGQEVKAVVVPRPGARPEPAALRAFVAERLAYFKVPAHLELRDAALPRNAVGKVMKHVLTGDGSSDLIEE